MDIHRCRFVPYQPRSINALAFSQNHPNSKQKTPTDLRLALGRENGDIEIWNPLGGRWAQERVLRGSSNRTVEQLAWTCDILVDEDNEETPLKDDSFRLFSSGGSPSITEWDLSTGCPKRSAEGNFADIWCFAAQPQWRLTAKEQDPSKIAANPAQMLAAGCSDGTIVLFSTADGDLQFLRVLAQSSLKKPKVISITWRDRNTVVAGHEDGMIRVVDVSNRTVIRTMSLGRALDRNLNVVWTVKCLPDGTILSGDSSGELKIWDAQNYSLVQKLKTHEADILDIATSANGDMIFTTGVDRRTVCYKPMSGQLGGKKVRWQQVLHRRYHQHDVKTLATFESKDISVLVSGGMDTIPVVVPLREIHNEYHRSLSHLPQKPQMSSSTQSRLMLTWWDRDLFIYHLPRRAQELEALNVLQTASPNRSLLARIQLKEDEYISAAQISADGRLIVVGTSAGVKLFQIRKRAVAGIIEVRSRPVKLPAGVSTFGAIDVGISPDGKWLYAVRASNVITMVKIVSGNNVKDLPIVNGRVIKLGRTAQKATHNRHGDYQRSISCVAFSSDSRIIATGDLSGAVHVWILDGHEDLEASQKNIATSSQNSSSDESDSDSDSDDDTDTAVIHGQKWIRNPAGSVLPQLDSAVLVLSFKPQSHIKETTQDPTLGLHPTRHTPHPIIHELPTSDTKLVVITSTHTIVEFDVLSAKLSDWSRRNPTSYLPTQFSQIKERVMGAFWDCSPTQQDKDTKTERLWLYGSTWLFMLDMARDLDPIGARRKIGKLGKYEVRDALPSQDSETQPIKVLTTSHQSRKRKRNAGAGDRIKEGEWQRPESIKGIKSTADEMEIDTGLMSPISDNDISDDDNEINNNDDGDVEMAESNALTILRRNQPSSTSSPTTTTKTTEQTSKSHSNSLPQPQESSSPTTPSSFLTHRYRSIFGIAVLSSRSDSNYDPEAQVQQAVAGAVAEPDENPSSSPSPSPSPSPSNLEIIVVERPMYDVDLIPRFDGGQEWGS